MQALQSKPRPATAWVVARKVAQVATPGTALLVNEGNGDFAQTDNNIQVIFKI